MDFTEFREKFGISQDKLHKLVLEAYEQFLHMEEMYQQDSEEALELGFSPMDREDFMIDYDFGSAREEYLAGFLQLLVNDEEEE